MVSPYVFPGIKKNLVPLIKNSKKSLITPDKVMRIVAKHCHVTVSDILSRNRKRDVCDARHIFCAVMKREFNYSLVEIGRINNRRDHTTTIHSIQTYNNRIKIEEKYISVTELVLDDIYEIV